MTLQIIPSVYKIKTMTQRVLLGKDSIKKENINRDLVMVTRIRKLAYT